MSRPTWPNTLIGVFGHVGFFRFPRCNGESAAATSGASAMVRNLARFTGTQRWDTTMTKTRNMKHCWKRI